MKKIKNIIILAGGDSSRFWPLKEKNLFSFIGKPIIEHLINKLLDYANYFFIVTNPSYSHKIKYLFSDRIKIINQQSSLPGMAGAVMSCKNQVNGEVFILNGEDIFDPNILLELNNKLKDRQLDMILMTKKVDQYFPGGYLKFFGKKITQIIEKPAPDKIPSNIVKLVADYFNNFNLFIKALEEVKTKTDDYYEQGINKLLKKNIRADYILYNNYWYPLKYPWHILPMMKHFLNQLNKNYISFTVKISKKAVINNPVFIGKNVKIGDFVKLVGPCYIDEGTVIGDYSLVRESHIGKNCLIGGGCEIARSYLADQVLTHRNYIGDSVISNDVMIGAQTLTANFRLDGKPIKSKIANKKIDSYLIKFGTIIGTGSKIGANVIILPGVKIGKNTFVGPGEVITEDIMDDKFIFQEKKEKIY